MGLTRSSFKKKIVIFGVAVFTALALTATGFATWVLSTTVNKEGGGNVTVGVTDESKIGISDITFKDNIQSIKFEPKEGDNKGRVRWNGEDSENLSVEFSVELTNIEVVANINVTLTLPEGVAAAAAANYITLPTWATGINIVQAMSDQTGEDWSYKVETRQADNGQGSTSPVKVGVLTCKLNFTWGSYFGGQNPSEYYDDHEDGKLVPDDQLKVQLDTFRAMIYGMEYDKYNTLPDSEKETLESPQYEVLITASP